MQNTTLEVCGEMSDFWSVRSKKPESFRPEEDVKELLKAAIQVTKKPKTTILNAAIRHGMAAAISEFKKLSNDQRAALTDAVEKILALKEKPEDKR